MGLLLWLVILVTMLLLDRFFVANCSGNRRRYQRRKRTLAVRRQS